MSKENFQRNHKRKTKPYGITFKNGYDSKDELNIVVNKSKERRKNKIDMKIIIIGDHDIGLKALEELNKIEGVEASLAPPDFVVTERPLIEIPIIDTDLLQASYKKKKTKRY
jgi:hypothetical protein